MIPEPAIYEIHAAASLPGGGKEEVGNKAWNLMRMAKAGLPVPAGFVLPTEWCRLHRAGRCWFLCGPARRHRCPA